MARLKSGAQMCQVANMIYQNGTDKPQEIKKALFLWSNAMEKGSEPAKYSYAMCLKTGQGSFV